jgi:ligand-binding sensor domain-containing protein
VSRERCELGAIATLAAQRDGALWVGRRDAELLRYAPASGRLETFARAPRDVLALLPAADGALWIGARDGGLSRLEPESGMVTTERHDPVDPQSLSEDDVDALYEDRTGNLWIGTWNGGVDMLDPYAQAFRAFENRPYDLASLPDNDVASMTETPDGRIWLGSRNAVLAVGDVRTGRFRTVAPALAARGRVRALAHDRNEVFVGTAQGLAFVDAVTGGEIAPSPGVRRSGLDIRAVSALAVGPRGDLLVASGDGAYLVSRAARAAGGQETPVRKLTPALPQGISAIDAPASGRLWVAASDGRLLVKDASASAATGDDLRPFPLTRPADDALFITSLLEDSRGHLWVGTREGLADVTVATGATRWFNRSADLPSVSVAGILEDEDGFIWYANNRGWRASTRIPEPPCSSAPATARRARVTPRGRTRGAIRVRSTSPVTGSRCSTRGRSRSIRTRRASPSPGSRSATGRRCRAGSIPSRRSSASCTRRMRSPLHPTQRCCRSKWRRSISAIPSGTASPTASRVSTAIGSTPTPSAPSRRIHASRRATTCCARGR